MRRKRSGFILTATWIDPEWSVLRRFWERIKARRRAVQYLDEPTTEPSLPLLTPLKSLEATDWIRTWVPIFGIKGFKLLPGDFPAYARVYHPFDDNGELSAWREHMTIAERDAIDPAEGMDFALRGARNLQARIGP